VINHDVYCKIRHIEYRQHLFPGFVACNVDYRTTLDEMSSGYANLPHEINDKEGILLLFVVAYSLTEILQNKNVILISRNC
jgi:hypothetical protein